MPRAIIKSFSLNARQLNRLLDAVPSTRAGTAASGLNTPLWICGHLAQSMQGMAGQMGLPGWLPEDWSSYYATGTIGTRDSSNKEDFTLCRRWLDHGTKTVLQQLQKLSKAELDSVLPDPHYRRTFPTLGEALTHILSAHTAHHMGQLSCWLRLNHIDVPPEMDLYGKPDLEQT